MNSQRIAGNRRVALGCCLAIGLLTGNGLGQTEESDWTRFRGPNGTGLVADARLPVSWNQDEFLWRVKLEGSGSSSPVVWRDRVFLNSCDPETATFQVECRNLNDGGLLWKKSYVSLPHRMHRRNSHASSTPAVDAEHVYVTFANPQHTILAAIDHEGKEI